MRIMGYLPHPRWKITVFKMETRLSVKFETDGQEVIYKFGLDDHLQTLEDVQGLVDAAFLSDVERLFASIKITAAKALERISPASSDTFEEII